MKFKKIASLLLVSIFFTVSCSKEDSSADQNQNAIASLDASASTAKVGNCGEVLERREEHHHDQIDADRNKQPSLCRIGLARHSRRNRAQEFPGNQKIDQDNG